MSYGEVGKQELQCQDSAKYLAVLLSNTILDDKEIL